MELKQLTSTWQQNGQEQKSDFRCFGGLVYGEFVFLYDIYDMWGTFLSIAVSLWI